MNHQKMLKNQSSIELIKSLKEKLYLKNVSTLKWLKPCEHFVWITLIDSHFIIVA